MSGRWGWGSCYVAWGSLELSVQASLELGSWSASAFQVLRLQAYTISDLSLLIVVKWFVCSSWVFFKPWDF